MQQDPSIEPKAGVIILRACIDVLSRDPDLNAAELARRCLVRYRAADASWVAHLARAALTTLDVERRSGGGDGHPRGAGDRSRRDAREPDGPMEL